MLVELSRIHGAPQPVRETWDEQKMEELTTSIRDMGIVVPIKLRPNSDGYEIVYGHRRTEAARRAGLSHIPAEIEDMDDAEAFKQAIAENIVREDMDPLELAKALARFKVEYELSNAQIGAFFGISDSRVGQFVSLAHDPILDYVNSQHVGSLHKLGGIEMKAEATRSLGDLEDRAKVLEVVGTRGAPDVRAISQAIRPLSKEDRQAILAKVKTEHLGTTNIEKVAKAVQQASQQDKPLLRESALAIRGDATMYEDMVRQRAGMLSYIEREDKAMQRKKQAEVQDYDELVKEGINYIRGLYSWIVDYAYEGIEQGKFSPEAARYVIKRFDGLVTEYQTTMRPSLENIKD